MESLNYYLKRAKDNGRAIGHFNFATEDVLKAIIDGAKEAGAEAVMVGTSEAEADFVNLKVAAAMVMAMRIEFEFPVFLNADHFKSFEKCKEAIDAGYDSVIIDASRLEFKHNIELTKTVVDYAKAANMGITVEGELGYLRGSSQIQQKIVISRDDYTRPEQAIEFVHTTGIDRLAVVFGNIHGIVTEQEEKLDIEYFKQINATMPDVYYVLHGASGLKDEEIVSAIKAGIANVHFNTELRVAYKQSIDAAIHEKPSESAPYQYLAQADDEVKKIVIAKTKLFMGVWPLILMGLYVIIPELFYKTL